MLRIPYSFLPPKVTKSLSRPFFSIANSISKSAPFLKTNLIRADFDVDDREYVAMCITSTLLFFVFAAFMLSIMLKVFYIERYYTTGPLMSLVFSIFIFFQQIVYPGMVANRKIRDIERNLLPAMQNVLVEIESGVPLFNVLVNVSKGNYGKVSVEFSRIIKEINAGKPQIEALTDSATRNPSLFFRRAIWQIVNGMKSGASISDVVKEAIHALSEEQIIQIQSYGSQLNPLAMFYMLIAVIVPALSITLIIVISSFISASETTTKLIFWGLYSCVVFFQMMFLGLIKSRRPNLMGS